MSRVLPLVSSSGKDYNEVCQRPCLRPRGPVIREVYSLNSRGLAAALVRRPRLFRAGLSAALLALSLAWIDEVRALEDDGKGSSRGASGELVRCPKCDEQGKATCPRCGGKGSLTRTCRRCQGTGHRPCPQCTKEQNGESQQTATPGQISCTYCGGKGYLGTRTRKLCTQCGGAGVNECPTCLGKGGFECPKLRPAGICPACRLTGKVTCGLCEGTKLVSPALARSDGSPSEEGDSENPSAGGEPDSKATQDRGNGTKEPSETEVALSIGERLDALGACYSKHVKIFLRDLHKDTEPVEKEITEALRRVESSSLPEESSLPADLKELRRRIHHLLERRTEIHEIYNRFRRNYLNCQSAWQKDPSRESQGATGGASKRRFDPLEVRVKICERLAGQLDGERAIWLQRESDAIQKHWQALKEKVQVTLAELAEKAQKQESDADAKNKKSSRKVKIATTTAPQPSVESDVPATRVERDGHGKRLPGRAPRGDRARAPSEVASRAREKGTSPRRLPQPSPSTKREERGSSPGSVILNGVLWLASVLVASYLFVTVSRWLRRSRNRDDDLTWEPEEPSRS